MTVRMGIPCARLIAGLALAGSMSVGAAQAQIVPGDTFSVDVSGFNSAGTVGYLLTPDLTATFGTTQTFAGAGINGQDITVASFATVGATNTVATIRISTPTNFLTTNTVSGTTISQLQFDIGDANSGSNTLAFLTAIGTHSSAGTVYYSTSSTLSLAPATTLTSGNTQLAAVEAVSAETSAISGFAVRQFDYVFTFANPVASSVPDAASWLTMLIGFGMLGAGLRYRRRVTGVAYA